MTRSQFRRLLEDLFRMDLGTLKDSDTRDSILEWSSLVDVQILTAISSEMGVEPDADFLEEFTACDTVGNLFELLERKGAFPKAVGS